MDKPGPTGQFPQGKISDDDEGELNISISTEGKTIIVNFGTLVSWLGMEKEDALEFADVIRKKAEEL